MGESRTGPGAVGAVDGVEAGDEERDDVLVIGQPGLGGSKNGGCAGVVVAQSVAEAAHGKEAAGSKQRRSTVGEDAGGEAG